MPKVGTKQSTVRKCPTKRKRGFRGAQKQVVQAGEMEKPSEVNNKHHLCW